MEAQSSSQTQGKMAQNKPKRIDLRSDEYGLNKRQFLFCLYMLACQGKKPRWAAGQSGFSGRPCEKIAEPFRAASNSGISGEVHAAG
jgi:hypothetical protein